MLKKAGIMMIFPICKFGKYITFVRSMMIKKLYSNKELVDKMGRNSAAIAENYDWSLIVAKLVDLINRSEIIKDE